MKYIIKRSYVPFPCLPFPTITIISSHNSTNNPGQLSSVFQINSSNVKSHRKEEEQSQPSLPPSLPQKQTKQSNHQEKETKRKTSKSLEKKAQKKTISCSREKKKHTHIIQIFFSPRRTKKIPPRGSMPVLLFAFCFLPSRRLDPSHSSQQTTETTNDNNKESRKRSLKTLSVVQYNWVPLLNRSGEGRKGKSNESLGRFLKKKTEQASIHPSIVTAKNPFQPNIP